MLLALLTAILGAWLLTPLVIRAATALKLYDQPGEARRVHRRPTPRLGGIAVFAATAIAVAVTTWVAPELITPERARLHRVALLGGMLVFATGVADDLWSLRPRTKLAIEALAALLVCYVGLRIDVLRIGPFGDTGLGLLGVPLTVLWILAVTNAFNLVDGLDGLATGIGIVAVATLVGAAYLLGNPGIVLIGAALLGALLGFGPYNVAPARIFLGDSGSLFIGFLLAVLSVHSSLKSATALLVIVPLCAFAVPLLDMALAVLRRWLRRTPIFHADARHIHHRLLAMGLPPQVAARVLVLAAGAMGLLGMLITYAAHQTDIRVALIGAAIVSVLAWGGLRRLNYYELAEAGLALTGVLGARQLVQERIVARELASQLADTPTLAHLNDALREGSAALRFLRMEIAPASDWPARLDPGSMEADTHAWTFQCPLDVCGASDHDAWVLRIWGDASARPSSYGAERVARLLLPALEARLAQDAARRQAERRHERERLTLLAADAAPPGAQPPLFEREVAIALGREGSEREDPTPVRLPLGAGLRPELDAQRERHS